MLKLFTGLLLLSLTNLSQAKSISFSFDDVPRRGSFLTGTDRAAKLISSLKTHTVKAAMYVNSAKVSKEGLERIKRYSAAGHIIGNHTHSHQSADIVLQEVFLEDFRAGDRLLRSWGFEPTYFRYPYLHRGKSLEKVTAIREEVLKKGYQDGFVTVDNYDWYIDAMFQRAVNEKKKIDYAKLKSFYVETLYKGILHYEELAVRVYGRSPKHVMLLHENDLAAMYVGDLISHLKINGWDICSPEESYADPDLKPFPAGVLRHGQGRVVAHATEKGFPKPLISGLEDEEVLEKLWADYGITQE